MKTPQDMSAPDLHTWASQQLEIPLEASPREAKAAFMNKLADFQWLPPPSVEESQEYWMRPTGAEVLPSLREQAFQDEEFRLRGQVDEFARAFFSLEPDRRRTRYQTLVDQCAWSVNLSARLRALAAGLDLNSGDWQNAPSAQRELAQHVCQLFTLPAAERSRRRWQLLQELQDVREAWQGETRESAAGWSFAARSLKECYPDLAGLAPVFIDELARARKRRRSETARLPEVVTNPQPLALPVPASGGGSGNWPIWIFVGVAIGILRAVVGSNSNSPPPQTPRFNEQQKKLLDQNQQPIDINKLIEEQRKLQKRDRNPPKEGTPPINNRRPGEMRPAPPQQDREAPANRNDKK